MDIETSRTALLIVDMQNDFLSPGSPKEVPAGLSIVPKLERMAVRCRNAGARVVYTVHAHRRDGSDLGLYGTRDPRLRDHECLVEGEAGSAIHPDIAPQGGDIVITKRRYSAFFGTDLDIVLRGLGIDTVIVGGITTENCCHATARDAMYRDYRVFLLSDGTATRDLPDQGHGALTAAEIQKAMLVILGRSTASVVTIEDILEALPPPRDA
jgi:biuret amidohydrolase